MNINGRPTSRGGNINGRPAPSASRTFVTASDKKLAPMVGATTSPRAILASVSDYLVADSGLSQATDQFFATRTKMRIQGGKWAALAPVFVGGYVSTNHTPMGTPTTAPYTCSWVIELSNGTTPTAFDYLNTGGTYAVQQGKFNGNVDGIIRPNDVVIGDFIYASDFGLSSFSWSDRALLPWVRVAYSKTATTDNLGAVAQTDYNAPMNQWYATCTSYANAKTLINAVPASFNGGNNFWSSGDTDVPSCIGWIGIPMDDQRAIVFLGTSIVDGDGNMTNYKNGGVNPANNAMQNYDLLGYPCAFAQNLSNQVPVWNLAVGGSAMGSLWSDTAADYSWSTSCPVSWERLAIAKLANYADVFIINDVHNDGGISAAYADVLKNLCNVVRGENPALKIYGCRVPNGYVDITGATVAYSAALDTRWSAQDAVATAGYIDGMLNVRSDQVTNLYVDLGTQVTSTTTSLGTTTTLNDSAATWLPGQWVNSWVSVGGIKKLISANTRTQLTFGAYGAAVGSGVAYLILGNTSGDGIHPNSLCQKSNLAVNFKTELARVGFSMPYFTRTS